MGHASQPWASLVLAILLLYAGSVRASRVLDGRSVAGPATRRGLAEGDILDNVGRAVGSAVKTVGCFFDAIFSDGCDKAPPSPSPKPSPAPERSPSPSTVQAVCTNGTLRCCSPLYKAANPSDGCCFDAACNATSPAPAPAAELVGGLAKDGSASLLGSQVESGAGAAGAGATASDGGGTNVAAIVGGVVGGLAALALALGLFVFWRRRQNRRHADHSINKFLSEKVASLPGGPPQPVPGSPGVAAAAKSAALGAPAGPGLLAAPAAAAGHTTLGPLGSALLAVELTATPAGAAAGADLDSARRAGFALRQKSLATPSDPLLSFVTTTLSTLSDDDATGGLSWHGAVAAALGEALAPWTVDFAELSVARLVGEGSFGRVYKAYRGSKAVAVKLLIDVRDASATGSEAAVLSNPVLGNLRREAELMASPQLQSPHLIKFVGVCGIPPAIVTEYCSRGSLADVLAHARRDPAAATQLSWRRRLSIALGAAEGMRCLHNHSPPILHRDLKTANLLLDESWTAKVSDFSLSKLAGPAHIDGAPAPAPSTADSRSSSAYASATAATVSAAGERSTVMGGAINPRFTAPELLTGSADAGLPADVFSFGVCLWELLTWEQPWEGTPNAWNIVNAVAAGQRLPIPEPEHLPGPPGQPAAAWAGLTAYVDLLQRCWAQRPEGRPSFEAVAEELRALLAACPPGSPPSSADSASLHGAVVSLAAATPAPTALSLGGPIGVPFDSPTATWASTATLGAASSASRSTAVAAAPPPGAAAGFPSATSTLGTQTPVSSPLAVPSGGGGGGGAASWAFSALGGAAAAATADTGTSTDAVGEEEAGPALESSGVQADSSPAGPRAAAAFAGGGAVDRAASTSASAASAMADAGTQTLSTGDAGTQTEGGGAPWGDDRAGRTPTRTASGREASHSPPNMRRVGGGYIPPRVRRDA